MRTTPSSRTTVFTLIFLTTLLLLPSESLAQRHGVRGVRVVPGRVVVMRA